MDATPGDFLTDLPADSAEALAAKWNALHAAADVVAWLGGLQSQPAQPIANPDGWRGDLARQGIDDIAAMMEPGLAALLRLHSQGGDPRPAAAALWQEFDRARKTVLALVRPIE